MPTDTNNALQSHAYNEFVINLPAHWKEVATDEAETLIYRSEVEAATITINVEFLVIPQEKMQAIAEHCIDSRLSGLQEVRISKVNLLSRSIKPTEGGDGIEVVFGAELPEERIFLYVGYVTSQKVFNFTLACQPDRNAAAALFDRIIPGLTVKLP